MDTVAMILKKTKSIPYTYHAYKSPTHKYDLATHSDNKYVILHLPSEAYATAETRSAVYLNWINDKQPDLIEERQITDYSPLIDLVDAVERHFDFTTVLEKYGILDNYGEYGAASYINTYKDEFLDNTPFFGFNLDYVKRRCASVYFHYRAWLSFVSDGTIDPEWKYYTSISARYNTIIGFTESGVIQDRYCASFLDVVESLLSDLFYLGDKVLQDGQRILRCRSCNKEFVGTYNKNRQFCENCSTPAAKQKMYRMRKKEAQHAQESNP